MKQSDKERLTRILEQDKEELSEASRRAAMKDFKRVAEEYFETDGGFTLTLREGKRGKEVIFSFRMVRAKNFITIR